MQIINTVKELQQLLEPNRDKKIGFVPTMGALHQGHLSLVKLSKGQNHITVVSVFVNPTQFNDKNDLKNYPRTEQADADLLSGEGVDIMFLPSVEEIYPQTDTRQFNFAQLEAVMEGAHRPGHFNGVAQVVSRLFEIVKPTNSYFGEKDFQQLAIIRKMTKDLNLPLQIVGCPIVRSVDGLALSSRNALLTPYFRSVAPSIFKAMSQGVAVAQSQGIEKCCSWVIEQIEQQEGLKVEYFQIVNSATLQPIEQWNTNCEKRACIAVKAGDIRLIDNIAY